MHIKCSRTSPCRKCIAAGVKCEFRGDGIKRSPISREYTSALESRVEMLESFLLELKYAPSEERYNMVEGINLVGRPPPSTSSVSPNCTERSPLNSNRARNSSGVPIFDGPSSIYTSEILPAHSTNLTPQPSPLTVSTTELHERHLCTMIIDRDSFLTDYLISPSSSQYCSADLVYAISALGALMAKEKPVRMLAEQFNMLAQKGILFKSFETSSLPTLQALQCCAYFEIGQGNASKGWMLSGMAFRMAHDLGLQRDPDPDSGQNRMYMSPGDLNLRRHICPLWDGWLRDQELGNLDDSEPEYISALISKKYFELASIIQDTLTQTLMSRKREHLETTRWIQLSLNRLNTRFWNWYDSLPGDMRWNRWASSSETYALPCCTDLAQSPVLKIYSGPSIVSCSNST
ncbi:hypothetical protein DH86_00000389 [Scytalidium sp. 3C]|nr:hypothetical protein DH86_00000389 [Scytalidium sp. 3C]